MKGLEKVKVMKFHGSSADKDCERTLNKMIRKGWHPVNFSTHISPESDELVVTVLMGYSPDYGKDGHIGEDPMQEEDSLVQGYERCPECGNLALEIEVDNSARCEYCGYITSNILKRVEEDEDYVY